ncbi:hypothetical protein HBN50_05730 [Halobacteriovorax sp. GB3]|uniref:hypothetical protein n=1 Tax=Halobacteriovorax sp. GB3 TaxID=2719615 RepID=UPI002362156B|nr:hypothetical protein [Halobacteriovorax sp. GB3]MDD0852587.1 hypothetical protein [Halobacteriovorax sp. GB3]
MKRVLLLTSILFLSASCGMRKGISSSFAKEFCSCVYVEKKEKSFCQSYASYILPVTSYSIEEKLQKKTIKASFLFSESVATFTSKKFGCQLN